MDTSEYRALFLEESRAHVAALSQLLSALQPGVNPSSVLDEVFRHAHSLKSMAAAMGHGPLSALAHRFEDLLGACRRSSAPVPQAALALMQRGVDALESQVQAAADDAPMPDFAELAAALAAAAAEVHPPVVAAEPRGPLLAVSLRVTSTAAVPAARAFLAYRKLERLGEVVDMRPPLARLKEGVLPARELRVVLRGVTEEAARTALTAVADLESVQTSPVDGGPAAAREPEPALAPAPDTGERRAVASIRVRTDLLAELDDALERLARAEERLAGLVAEDPRPAVGSALADIESGRREVRARLAAVRTVPLGTLTERYPRLLRDLAATLGKEAGLEVRGEELSLDRAILEQLDDLFVHLLRNAIDHGLEPAEAREQLGKPRAGRVLIAARREPDRVVITVADDGAGLDLAALRRTAVERGLLTAEVASSLSAREAGRLVCLPGLSTKTEISPVSGRGIGLDVVRTRIEALGGSLEVESEAGKGCRFVLALPAAC